MNYLVLFSGGFDSTVALYHTLNEARKNSGRVNAISFDYGQRHVRELSKAAQIIYDLRAGQFGPYFSRYLTKKITYFPPVGSLMQAEPVTKYDQDDPDGAADSSYIPHRNLNLIAAAAQWAHTLDCPTIVTGIRGGFSDCTREFERAMEAVLRVSDPSMEYRVTSPVHTSRANSYRIACTIPECIEAIAQTLTCFEGTELPCGRCLPCRKRAKGFAELGIEDPLLVRLRSKEQRSA